MSEVLKRLIEEVEAGKLEIFRAEQALGHTVESRWVRGAFVGSLDAALALLDALLPDYTWGRAPGGQMWVRTLGGPYVSGGDDHPPARGLLLAVLRAKLGEADSSTASEKTSV